MRRQLDKQSWKQSAAWADVGAVVIVIVANAIRWNQARRLDITASVFATARVVVDDGGTLRARIVLKLGKIASTSTNILYADQSCITGWKSCGRGGRLGDGRRDVSMDDEG